MEIAIVGGGIGGLAAAAFLHRQGIASTVYEQASRFGEVGAGLVLAPNVARLLRRLGADDLLDRRAVRLDTAWEFRRWEDGRVLSSEDLTDRCRELYGEDTFTAHRADLLAAIRAHVPDSSVRLGRACTGVVLGDDPATDPVTLTFADGSTETADVVIGADGVHSVLRAALTPAATPTFSGLCAFRALVPADAAPEFARRHAQTIWLGPGHHVVHYPISAGRFVNLVAIGPAGGYTIESWSATATIAELLDEYDGWDERVTDLIRAANTPGRWALLDRAPLDRWTSGRATLLGDAAHPMFPFFAQGAAQAIEDAAVLARCLAGDNDGPTAALEQYEELRRPRTTRIQLVSHERADVNHLPDGPEQQARDAALAEADPLVASGWIYAYEPDGRPAER